MSNIDYQALREAAEKATPGRVGDRIDGSGSIKYECHGYDGSLVLRTDHKNMEYSFIGDNSNADELFFRLCVPDVILALLDERERNQRYIKSRDQENEDIALTVGKLRVELEAAENNLIDSECHVAELEEALRDKQALLEASEKRIAELEAREISLPERSSMLHRTDFHEDYQTVMAYKVSEVIAAIRAAGIRINGED